MCTGDLTNIYSASYSVGRVSDSRLPLVSELLPNWVLCQRWCYTTGKKPRYAETLDYGLPYLTWCCHNNGHPDCAIPVPWKASRALGSSMVLTFSGCRIEQSSLRIRIYRTRILSLQKRVLMDLWHSLDLLFTDEYHRRGPTS